MGAERLIGTGSKPLGAKTSDDSAPPATDKLARSNRVSLAEFTFFAHSVVEHADAQYRAYHAMLKNDREAANTRRKIANAQRRSGQAIKRGYAPR